MSRTVLIIVLLFTVVFATIVLTLNKRSAHLAETMSSSVYETNAENLGAYALNWAIKQVTDGKVKSNITLPGFNVHLNGKIDSIRFYNFSSDSIHITAYVKWIEGGDTVYHQSNAVLKSSNNIPTNAVGTGGGLTVKGSATVNGDTTSHAVIVFEEIFGMTKAEMKAAATDTFVGPIQDPTPVDSITWIDGDVHFTSGVIGMSGLLIVTGNCKWSGADFDGIIYVMGEMSGDELFVSGNSIIKGAIIAECDATVTGNTTVTYDSGIVNGIFDNYLPPGSVDAIFKILAWKK